MNSSKLIGKVLLTFFSMTIIFVGYLYYLGATVPVETIDEVLVDGQWVRYRDYNTDFPGDIRLYDAGPYGNPLYLSGEAGSAWFFEGTANAEVLAEDGTILWEGFVMSDERQVYDMIIPFELEADIGNYTGDVTLIIYQGDESDAEVGDNPQYSYAASILISNQNSIESAEEDI